jgi:hypothetical protein
MVTEAAQERNISLGDKATTAQRGVMADALRDGSFWLGSVQHPEYRLRRAIELKLSRDDGQVILEWPEADSLFGYGQTLSDAVTDFRFSLVELYISLLDSQGDLGPAMSELLARIDSYVRRDGGA